MPATLFGCAGQLCPGTCLGSLDALHLAAANGLGRALIAFAAYDKRLVESAQSLHLPVESPGSP
jgi:hypothetical protein